MKFEFTVQPSFNFVTSFAEKFGIPVFENRLAIPASMGEGYIKKVDVGADFKFVLHHYTLNQPFYLKRKAPKESNDLISIVFNSTETPTNADLTRKTAIQFLQKNGSAIQIASSSLGTETFFPANRNIYFGVIGIRPAVLRSFLDIAAPEGLIRTILSGDGGFFYHESMFPEAQRILQQLSEINDLEKLHHIYTRIKIQELLYLLFNRLMNRNITRHNLINKADIDHLYAIRTAIIADLSRPPRLEQLAKTAGMSETKMKLLFRQTFGDTIYNYYLKARMEEAAFLLKHASYTVSEVGYRLGFSNLSHFSRLFEKHYGVNPKKYSLAG